MATDVKSKEQIVAAFQSARAAGNIAGQKRIQELSELRVPDGKNLESYGGSSLHLHVDGRTKLGRLLAEIDDPEFSVRSAYGGGFSGHIRYEFKYIPPVNGQEFSIKHEADIAAAKVLEEMLGVSVYARAYES